jgi:hypothetical protein
MTPLAQRTALETENSARHGRPSIALGSLRLAELQCFEVTAITALLDEFERGEGPLISRGADLCFLPSAATWIEWRSAEYRRAAYLLAATESRTEALVRAVTERPFSAFGPFRMTLGSETAGEFDDKKVPVAWIAGALVAINASWFTRRREHPARLQLQRRLARMRGNPGRLTLRPWIEVEAR